MRLPGTVRPRQGTPADNDASKMRTVCDSAPWPALHPAGPGALVGTSVRRAASASHGPRWTAATWAASGPALLYPPGSREAPQGPRVRLCQAASNADSTQGRFSTPYKVLGVNASRYMDGSSCRVCARPPPRGEVRACVVSSVAPRETGDSKAPTRGRGPRPHRGPDGPRDGRLQSAHARCRYGRPFSRPLPGLVRLANPTTPYLTPACCQGHPPPPVLPCLYDQTVQLDSRRPVCAGTGAHMPYPIHCTGRSPWRTAKCGKLGGGGAGPAASGTHKDDDRGCFTTFRARSARGAFL